MLFPFEVDPSQLEVNLEEVVSSTIASLSSEFLVLPEGSAFLPYIEFRNAYEVLKRHTASFGTFETTQIISALLEDSRAFIVLRTILGLSAPEWAELSRVEYGIDVGQGAARAIDRNCRKDAGYIARIHSGSPRRGAESSSIGHLPKTNTAIRIANLINVAVDVISKGAPRAEVGLIHRLDKFDTSYGLESLRHAANEHVPFAVLLYERLLGRPFASHRDSVSGLIGETMETAVDENLRKHGVTYRKTGRAERIPGFGQAPDFCIPDETRPIAVIEAKITSDDGTARDKVARILRLANQRDEHVKNGLGVYEVIACIDGRGFGVRREDMRQLILALDGKVFTTSTLDSLVEATAIRALSSR